MVPMLIGRRRRPLLLVLVYLAALASAAAYGCTIIATQDPADWPPYPLAFLALLSTPTGPFLAASSGFFLSFTPVDSPFWAPVPALVGGGLIQALLYWLWSEHRRAQRDARPSVR